MMGLDEDQKMPPQFVTEFLLTQMDPMTMLKVVQLGAQGDYQGAGEALAENVDPEAAA